MAWTFEICQNLQISFKSKHIGINFFANKASVHNLKNDILFNQNWPNKRNLNVDYLFLLAA